MKTKQTLHSLQLVFGAAEAEANKLEIDPEFIPQIAQARTDVLLLRGTDVIDALIMLRRSGLPLGLNVQRRTRGARAEGEKSQRTDKR